MVSKEKSNVIALDAMGGDDAPFAVLLGANMALEINPDLSFLIFGDKAIVDPVLKKFPKLLASSTFIHSSEVVTSDMSPSHALRFLKNSSMRLAINAVKEGEARAVVSAGNTGAYLATAKFVLHTIDGIRRPALAAIMPTINPMKDGLMLDLGANIESTAEHLVQFAIMGDVYARHMFKIHNPRVALLNIGSEDNKGLPHIQEAATVMQQFLNYTGYVEGNDIMQSKADVIVCDGFAGNIALKSIEGTLIFMVNFMKNFWHQGFLSKIMLLLAAPLFQKLKTRLDPDRYNGAIFLGLTGIAIKAHGNSSPMAFRQAIIRADGLINEKFNSKILKAIQTFQNKSSEQ